MKLYYDIILLLDLWVLDTVLTYFMARLALRQDMRAHPDAYPVDHREALGVA
jgi:hypothetical protein